VILPSDQASPDWPALPWEGWRETAITLQLWMQIVGKVRLALTPWLNHSWHVPFYMTARGLGTSPIPIGHEILEIDFDFIEHSLHIATSLGRQVSLPLQHESVADFYRRVFGALDQLDVSVSISPMPSEVADPIPFPEDTTHAVYDKAAAHRFWRALIQVDRVLKLFRSSFIGKASPVHFFWGSFDLAVTRFSGRVAPKHPGGVPGLSDAVACEAYSHEVSSAGFWPGSDAYPHAAFYSYAYPELEGYRAKKLSDGAFDPALGEFILPYDRVRSASSPDNCLLAFLSDTYAAAADAGQWDRTALECDTGRPGTPRIVTEMARKCQPA
jgi:Family of unknown function (DUF5996)